MINKEPTPPFHWFWWDLLLVVILGVTIMAIWWQYNDLTTLTAILTAPPPLVSTPRPPVAEPGLPPLVCYDSDATQMSELNGGRHPEFFTTGHVTYGYQGYEEKEYDSCHGDTLYEVGCAANDYDPGYLTYRCPKGCFDGRCLP